MAPKLKSIRDCQTGAQVREVVQADPRTVSLKDHQCWSEVEGPYGKTNIPTTTYAMDKGRRKWLTKALMAIGLGVFLACMIICNASGLLGVMLQHTS